MISFFFFVLVSTAPPELQQSEMSVKISKTKKKKLKKRAKRSVAIMEADLKHMEDIKQVELHGENLPNGDKFQQDRKFFNLTYLKYHEEVIYTFCLLSCRRVV